MPQTIRLHRVIKAAPEKVYRAFLNGDALSKFLPPFGFTCKIEHLDAKVGGTFRMAFANFTNQASHAFGGTYLALEPGKLLRYNDVFDDPNLPGTMLTTIELSEVFCGTDMRVTQEGIPDMIPEAACYLGWQETLIQLAQLVEPDIRQ
jgi:uncharacterized protein YndB with AHSA1/START domain